MMPSSTPSHFVRSSTAPGWRLLVAGVLALLAEGRRIDAAEKAVSFLAIQGKVRTIDLKADWRADVHSVWTGPLTVAGARLLHGQGYAVAPDGQPVTELYGGSLACRDKTTGAVRWTMTHRAPVKREFRQQFQGVQSQPTVVGDRVYYVSPRGELVCLDLEGFYDQENDGPEKGEARTDLLDADVVWSLDMPQQLGVLIVDQFDFGSPVSSPLVVDDLVFVLTGNGSTMFFGGREAARGEIVPRPEAPSFIAVDRRTGKVRWTSNAPGKDIMYGQWGSPALIGQGPTRRVVFPGGDGRLYAFHPQTGELAWKVECNEPTDTRWTAPQDGTRKFPTGRPAVSADAVFTGTTRSWDFSGRGCGVFAFDLRADQTSGTPSRRWKFDGPEYFGTMCSTLVHEQVLYALSEPNQKLFALDANTGELLWSLSDLPCSDRMPSIAMSLAEGRVYVPCDEGIVRIPCARTLKLDDCLVLSRGKDSREFVFCSVIAEWPVVYATSKRVVARYQCEP